MPAFTFKLIHFLDHFSLMCQEKTDYFSAINEELNINIYEEFNKSKNKLRFNHLALETFS